MNAGDKLKSLRLKMRKTLKEQSDIFGVSLNSVYRWEHNLATPRKSMMKKIAEHYDVPLEWLLQTSASDDSFENLNCVSRIDQSVEQQLMRFFRQLADYNQYKVLGYAERLYDESMERRRDREDEIYAS